MTSPQHDVRDERLAELVAQLTGEDPADSAEATCAHRAPASRREPLEVVARAIIDLRESSRALRVTRYLDHPFDPVIDLRVGEEGVASLHDVDVRFHRRARVAGILPQRAGGRPAGNNSGFAPA